MDQQKHDKTMTILIIISTTALAALITWPIWKHVWNQTNDTHTR